MTTKSELLVVIRQHCLNCCGGSWSEVEKCTSGLDAKSYSTCALWNYRFGSDPEPNESRKLAARKMNIRKKLTN